MSVAVGRALVVVGTPSLSSQAAYSDGDASRDRAEQDDPDGVRLGPPDFWWQSLGSSCQDVEVAMKKTPGQHSARWCGYPAVHASPLFCMQGVVGSSPIISTLFCLVAGVTPIGPGLNSPLSPHLSLRIWDRQREV